MTVRELIQQLREMPPDALVLIDMDEDETTGQLAHSYVHHVQHDMPLAVTIYHDEAP
jgi:hypothetical protein